MFAYLFFSVSVKDKMVSRLLSWLPGLNSNVYVNNNVGKFVGLNMLVNILKGKLTKKMLHVSVLVKLRLKLSLRRNLNFMEITLFNNSFKQ